MKIVWKDGEKRREQIREGVLLENFVSTHTEIKARMLVDKSKPVQEEDGKLVTYFHYVDGEIRYPWNLDEIASVGKLLTRLHQTIQKDGPSRTRRTVLSQRLHLDFARGNVLFERGTSIAVGVIDFETTAEGPIEQELGRTLSFLLVDTLVILRPSVMSSGSNDSTRNLYKHRSLIKSGMTMRKRAQAFLSNFGLPYSADQVFRWVHRYLKEEDYGNLNSVRDKAIEFLLHSSPASYPAS